jgi:hypothetical protein
MIDYLFCAPSEAAASADPALAAYRISYGSAWDLSIVNANFGAGLQVWADAGDTFVTDPLTGQQDTMHTFLPGYWLSVSQSARNAALEASPYLVLGADRDAANAGATRDVFVIALGPGQALDRFTGMHVSPLMAGANYPFG